MFEFYGFLIAVVRADTGLSVTVREGEDDPYPLTMQTASRDPYSAAAMLATELDLMTEGEIIELGEMIDAYL